MIYLDTSCLVKLVRPEEDSRKVGTAVFNEPVVVISVIAELETLIELKAGYMGGDYSLTEWRKLELELYAVKNQEPFQFRHVPSGIWEVAFRQHRNSAKTHCRTLDRLHLAAMEKLGIKQLLTTDSAMANAARELGMDVILPR
jgi:predicted nucleic acid-binding protein